MVKQYTHTHTHKYTYTHPHTHTYTHIHTHIHAALLCRVWKAGLQIEIQYPPTPVSNILAAAVPKNQGELVSKTTIDEINIRKKPSAYNLFYFINIYALNVFIES